MLLSVTFGLFPVCCVAGVVAPDGSSLSERTVMEFELERVRSGLGDSRELRSIPGVEGTDVSRLRGAKGHAAADDGPGLAYSPTS